MDNSIRNPTLLKLFDLFLQRAEDHALICIDPQEKIIGWLGAAQEILGYAPEEAIGQPAALIFTPEDRDRHFHEYELALARRNSRSEDDRWHLRKDGTRIWVTGSVVAIKDGAGQVLGYVKVIRDKTDLRAQIDLLEKNLDAARKSQERTHLFLSTLGHELRNPLAPIDTAAHIVGRLSTGPAISRAVEVIERQVGVLAKLADDLMEVARAGAGKIKLELVAADLRKVLQQATESMQGQARDKGVHLECVLPEAPLLVDLDGERFQRVVLNLLGNAIKYTPAGGSVWVKATEEGDEVAFRVEDTGVGIAPEVLPRIFDLFTQENRSADLVPGGLGIGLTIVKDLVELHGGSVQARSAGAGKGSEFTVRLPVTRR
jgi:PAS domain S-box-containing protein